MTDKQIIIDRVDVSGCIYFKMNNKTPMCRACNSGVGSPYCEYHKDCYYKQLKEKEKECEELEKLYKELQDDMLACNKCRATIKLQQQLDQLKAENEKLEQVLAEIKEIVERNHKTKEELFKIRHSRLTKFSMGALNGRHNLASEILQKISEVEE